MTNSPSVLKICVTDTVYVGIVEAVIEYVEEKVEWVVEQVRIIKQKFSVWMFSRPPTGVWSSIMNTEGLLA